MNDSNVEEVTIKEEKPKNPKRVAWAKKLGKIFLIFVIPTLCARIRFSN